MTPRIIFIGPTKSGTTWIDSYLRTRPEIALPKLTKETFFFDKQYDKGLDWYEAQFGPVSADRIAIEIAPSLFAKPEVSQRVASDLPDAKVVCTLRDPVDRAVSHYYHYLKSGEPDVGFDAMCLRHPDILEAGRYHQHLQRWRDDLGPDRLIILPYDRMRSDPFAFCRQLCLAIGIDYVPPTEALLSASVNEAAVPKNRLLARIVWRGAEILRRAGAHYLVNMVRETKLKKLSFGSAPDRDHKNAIRQEVIVSLRSYADEIAKVEREFGTAAEGAPG